MVTAIVPSILSPRSKLIELKERGVELALMFCGFVSVATSIAIVAVLLFEGASFFTEVTLSQFFFDTQWTPLFADQHFGIWPLVCGTVLISTIALAVALPLGLLIAIYLSEFAGDRSRRIIKPILEVLAGVPTIIYGYFALLFVTPLLQRIFPTISGFNALSPGIVMGMMILPMVASLSEDALFAVPRSIKEGAYALGASKLQMIFGVLLPSAFGGIVASFILAMSRAVGETMIVTIAAGQQANLSLNPLSSVETMTAYIVQVSLGDTPHGTLAYKTIFVVGGALFLITLALNLLSQWVRQRYQESSSG